MDLPLPQEATPDRPYLHLAAAGQEEGWRSAQLMASFDGGATWAAAGRTAPSAVMGIAETITAGTGSTLFDDRDGIVVQLLNDSMWLESRGDPALAGGANLAALGDELLQFGRVEPLGDRRFRLSHLLRGRRGTEWAASSHSPGEPFVLVDPATLVSIEMPATVVGAEAQLLAKGLGDGEGGVSQTRLVTGEGLRPPAPVHLRVERLGGADIFISWVRRSRAGWAWSNGADTPIGEEREAYRLVLSGAGFERAATVNVPFHTYTAAERAADGGPGQLTVTVAQLGTTAQSRAARLIWEA
jgi:hypothetical protein